MAVDASITNGTITNTAYKTAEQQKAEANTAKNDLDKQAFLKLLVAQMKYQDPMEPTDNTEYVSQLAQFSSLEAMNNMSQSVDLQRATGLIGKVVTAAKTDSVTGVATEKTGSVQFVSQSGSKTYLTINGDQYELSEVSKVWDDTYAAAYNLSDSFSKSLEGVPDASFITANNKDAYLSQVSALYASYASMDDYSRGFIPEKDQIKLGELVAQYRTLGVDLTASASGQASQAAQAAQSSQAEQSSAKAENETEEPDEEELDELAEELAEEVLDALLEDTDTDDDAASSAVAAALAEEAEKVDS